MLVKTPSQIHVDNIFIQPTFLCGKNCPNCYAKNRGPDILLNFNIWPNPIYNLFKNLVEGKGNVSTSHLVLSINTPENSEHTYNDFGQSKFIDYLWRNKGSNSECPIIHCAFKEINDCSYLSLCFLDICSLSNITKDITELEKKDERTYLVNWNLRVPRNCDFSSFVNKTVKKLDKYSAYINNVNLILDKTPLNKSFTVNERDSIDIYKKVAKLLSSKWKEDYPTFCLDRCYRESKEALSGNTKGCSANQSIVHVWPDGSLTGCPYYYNFEDSPNIITDGVYPAFSKVTSMRDFKLCNLPQSFNANKKRNYLAILS